MATQSELDGHDTPVSELAFKRPATRQMAGNEAADAVPATARSTPTATVKARLSRDLRRAPIFGS
jgi:hypothetical protein